MSERNSSRGVLSMVLDVVKCVLDVLFWGIVILCVTTKNR